MTNPDKSCMVFVMSSNYPRFSGDICGWFIHEISRRIAQNNYRVISLSPHTQNSSVHEVTDNVDINRFIYFFPDRFEKLAYGSGILYNLRKSPITFFSIFPFLLSEFFWAVNIIRKNPVKIIHTHWLIPQGLAGAFFHQVTHISHIATIHGSDLNLIKTNHLLRSLFRYIVKNSNVITVNSNYIKQQTLSIAPDSVQKIRVIPMGVDPEKYRNAEKTDLKTEFGTTHLILSVGRLIDIKGLIYLIEAMPVVLEKFPDTMLLLIGDGPEKEHLVLKVQELSLVDKVKFLGTIPQEELPSYYHSADVFILPSIEKAGVTEAFGVVLLEAMASGCPVIGSNVGGIPDIITNGENGFLVPEQDPDALADRIIQILSDEKLRGKIQENGYNRIMEFFTWDQVTKQFLGIYSQVLDPNVPLKTGDAP